MLQKKTYLAFFILCFAAMASFAQNEVDSLKKMVQSASHDTVRLRLLVAISEICDENDILANAKPAVEIAVKLLHDNTIQNDSVLTKKILNEKALALNNIGIYYLQKSLWDLGLDFFSQALEIRKQTRNKQGMAESFNNIGELYRLQGNISLALEYLNNSLTTREEIHDELGVIISINNVSLLYLQQGMPDKALESNLKGLTIAEKIQDDNVTSHILNNIGQIYHGKKDSTRALSYYNRSLTLCRKTQNKQNLATTLNNMGAVYFNLERKLDKALSYFEESLKLWKEAGDQTNYTATLVNMANIYLDKQDNEKAMEYGTLAMEAAHRTGYPENIKKAAEVLYTVNKRKRNPKTALEMHELFVKMSDSIFNEETQRSTIKQQMKYEYEKQQVLANAENEKELAVAEEAKKRQQLVSYATGFGLLMVILFCVFIFNRLQITRKQKLIIEDQKKIVDEKNKHITYSINYAKRIQDAILPSAEEMKKYFPEHFVFFQPREIVSGDFYWLSHLNGHTVFAVADCTGHGVPGAFMSMIGNTLLNEIVNEQKIVEPKEILNLLNEGIVHALHQESRSQDDGMDISVCCFDKEKGTVVFAGANHSLYLADEHSIRTIKGDELSIGSMFGKKTSEFTQQEIPVKEGMTLYFSTDGYADQVGGVNKKKFLSKRLQEFLQTLASLPAQEQGAAVKKTFEEWKGAYAQLDDVLLTGIKL